MQPEEKKKRITLRDLKNAMQVFSFMKPYKWHFIIGFALLVIASVLFMTFPKIIGEMMKAAEGKSEYSFTVNHYMLMLMAILIIQGLFSFIRVNLFAVVSEKGMSDLRAKLYEKILSQNLEFFEQRRVGEITSRITADIEKLQAAFSITFAEFLRQIFILLIGIVALFITQFKLSVTMLVVFPLIVVFTMFFGRYIKRFSKKRQDYLAKTNVIVEETFQSIASVKSFVNERFELNRYKKSLDNLVEIALHFAKAKGWFISFIIVFLFGAIFFILWRGALLIQAGSMESGDLVTFIVYTMLIGGSIAGLGNQYAELASAMGATDRVRDILEQDQELDIEAENSIHPISFQSKVEYKNVSFRYPTRIDMEVLKSINLSVSKGEKIALVGSSGSGKTTIIKLLARFYSVTGGEILIDGKNINDLEIKSLRKAIGVVPQEVVLFGGTIYENILYGNPLASEEEVYNAARQANALNFIENFPDKFNTLVGERGVQLSGGQKQRVAIARALLKNPQILILDEATSSLDAESEKLVQEALEQLMQNRTTFIIAHRLSTVRNADRILVIHQGEIVEQGTHAELSKMEAGFYNNLLKLQFENA
jgi:ATP-binding cassette, subfamily B, bacterial